MTTVPHSASSGNPLFTVYALIDARDELYRYIGITDNVYRRFKEHLAGEGKNPSKDAWIEDLKAEQVMLIMRTLDTTKDYHEALALEGKWIQQLLTEGFPLFNIATVRYSPPKKPVQQHGKLAIYDASKHHSTSAETDQILDAYLIWGVLPQSVSDRQRYAYRHHPRLEERRKLLTLRKFVSQSQGEHNHVSTP